MGKTRLALLSWRHCQERGKLLVEGESSQLACLLPHQRKEDYILLIVSLKGMDTVYYLYWYFSIQQKIWFIKQLFASEENYFTVCQKVQFDFLKCFFGKSSWCFINDPLTFETTPCFQSSPSHRAYLQGKRTPSPISLKAAEMSDFMGQKCPILQFC